MYKILKYIKKYNSNQTYVNRKKILYYLNKYKFIDNYKNNIIQTGGINYGNIDSLFEFIIKKTGSSFDIKTKNRYFVILYGVPGSGKTIARKISYHKIKQLYEEEPTIENMEKTFVDTSIDDIIYELKFNDDDSDIQKKLIDNKSSILGSTEAKQTDIDVNILKNLIDTSYDIYIKHKTEGNILSELLFYISAYFSKNIFMEISSPNIDYLLNIINGFCKFYNYIPIFIYPYINNQNILRKRTLDRGLIEGRFISMEGEFGIINKIAKLEEGYIQFQNKILTDGYKILNNIEDINKNPKIINVISYNSDFNESIYKKIGDNDFSDINNIIRNETIFMK